MDAHELFKSGKLAEAIDAQLAVVKAKPMDQGQRLFLFEMLVFAGDLDRAQRQIDAIQADQPEIVTALMVYRKLVDAERARRQVFSNKVQPGFLGPIPEHVRLRLLGLVKMADKALAEAATLFQEANSQIVPLQGSLNGQAFSGLRDGDDCLGSVLEVHAQGRYFWVPLEQVLAITMNAPRFPRDLLWIPAHLEMKEGEAGSVFLPALYPGTELESDPQLKLGRLTDWRGEDPVRGVGVKIFFVGADESSILDWRKLEFPA
jgi:type VI secretion system protein ImpE